MLRDEHFRVLGWLQQGLRSDGLAHDARSCWAYLTVLGVWMEFAVRADVNDDGDSEVGTIQD